MQLMSDQAITAAIAAPQTAKQPLSSYTDIYPVSGWAALKLGELWQYRELLLFLMWREIKVRYKQTLIGAGWALIQPLLTMVIFTLFFGRLARMPSDGVPYSVFSLTALVPWTFFANGLTLSSNSLVGNANLIGKVYFPRLLIPLATILSGFVDLVLAFVLLVLFALYKSVHIGLAVLWLPVFVLLATVCCLGVGLWLSALNVEYRDVRYVIPFLTQIWLFATPVAYPSSLLSEPWRTLYGLNPMVGVVQGFRWAVLGTARPDMHMLALSWTVAATLLITGAFYFRRMEQSFADIV
jgi:lipopolysaccharide transport system permease protein